MAEEITEKPKMARHLPTMFLGLIVAAIFLIAIFTYQVKSTEWAVVTTFGTITGVDDNNKIVDKGGGIFFRWPYPIQIIKKFDRRVQCFSGNVGKLDEQLTSDKKNVIVGIFVLYSINDPVLFFQMVINESNAEDRLNNFMRTSKNSIIGQFRFDELVNTNPKKMKLGEIEKRLRDDIAEKAGKIGITVYSVGINAISLPANITEKVEERMISERKGAASEYISNGKKEASIIRSTADKEKAQKLAGANATAKTIRAEGDAKAAAYYAAFRKNPQLAAFLRKLDSLRKILKTRTTLILDTDSAPFDVLKMNPDKLQKKIGD